MSLLQMSAQGGVLILVTVVVRAVAKELLPRRTFFALWAVALARLLVPFSVPSGYSAYTAAERSPVLRERLAPVILTPSVTGEPAAVVQNTVSAQTMLWAVGAVAVALYFITGYLYFLRKYRFSLPVEDEFAVQWMKEHPLRRKVSLRQSEQVSAPLTYGILRPVILLPKNTNWSDTAQLQYILAHEMTHIRHFDTVWKLLSTAALCLHWFNPLVWVLSVLFGRDMELLCDECVVRQFGEPSRPAYAMTLIQMEERKSGLQPFGSHFSKTAIEERIRAIMQAKKTSLTAALAAAVLVVGVSALFATSAAASTRISPEDAKILKQLQFPDWEQMSVAEFQERVWRLFDEPQMHEWCLKKLENVDEDYRLTGDDTMRHFLFDVLNALTAENWGLRAYGGAVVTDFPFAADQAVLEYSFDMEVLDREQLTVGEYSAAVNGVYADMQPLLRDITPALLGDQEYMYEWLSEKITDICEKWSSDSLRVFFSEYHYNPFSSLYDKDDSRIDGKRSNIDFSEYREAEPSEYAGQDSGAGEDPDSIEGRKSEIDLSGYVEAEAPGHDSEEKRDYPPATRADYDLLLNLKTADYQLLSLEKFNQNLLDWTNENYERMERIDASVDWGDVENSGLTVEEREFITLTTNLSGHENGTKVQSLYIGRAEEDPVFHGDLQRQTVKDGRRAWCGLYYQYSYHTANKARVTVGERDRCIRGFLNAVQDFWDKTPFEELLKLDKAAVVSRIQQLAAGNSTENVTISVDADSVGWETMDERSRD